MFQTTNRQCLSSFSQMSYSMLIYANLGYTPCLDKSMYINMNDNEKYMI
jgi:hypothetical protein